MKLHSAGSARGSPSDFEASFQEDGIFSDDTFLRHNASFGGKAMGNDGERRLPEFTLCLYVALNFLRGRNSIFLSYATTETPDALYGCEYSFPPPWGKISPEPVLGAGAI